MATTYTDTTVSNLVINKMTKAEYNALQNKSNTELYLVPDEIDSAPTSGSDNPVSSGGVYTALGDKQDTIDSSHKLSADLIEDGTTNKVINVKPDWNAASGNAAEILNKPTIPAAQVQSDWNATSGMGEILNKPTIPSAPGTLNTDNSAAQSVSSSEALSGSVTLHKVSKTGSYNDLLNKPTIPTVPTNVSAFTNDAGYLTSHQDISGKEDKVTIGTISGTSLSASLGTYYVGSSVGTLAVTLPTVSDATHGASVILNISTGASPNVTFTAASGVTITKSKGFAVAASKEYEINCFWNGTKWLITIVEFSAS